MTKDRVSEDLKDAMRARDRDRLDALRMLLTSVKNKEVELGHQLTDDEFVQVVSTEVKRRKEAADAYEQGGREELLRKERAEQAILEAYLPEQLSEDETRALVDEAVSATGASGPGDLGKVMGYVMGKAKGRIDGGEVNRLVRERLPE